MGSLFYFKYVLIWTCSEKEGQDFGRLSLTAFEASSQFVSLSGSRSACRQS